MRGWGLRSAAAAAATAMVASVVLPEAGAARAAGPVGPTGKGSTPTPILSVRRIPAWIQTTVAVQRLAATVAAAVGGSLGRGTPAGPGQTGCLVIGQGGRVYYGAHATEPLLPASNMKILTATAALDELGPASRYTTSVVAAAPPVGGVVAGNLYLVGAGDTVLRTPAYVASLTDQPVYTNLAALARQVRLAGVARVDGAVVGDESRYDRLRTVPSWKPVYSAEGDAGPLSALDVNDGYPEQPAGPPAGSTATGRSPDSSDPAVDAAVIFAGLLRRAGVAVTGRSTSGTAPPGARRIADVVSAPLGVEVDQALTVSDNTAAELFTKELGVRVGHAGTTAAGAAVIKADLTARRLPVSGLVVDDGSGLDRGDRVTCQLIEADLAQLGPSSVVARGLPVAGRTGSLRTRMVGTPAAGRVRAKTGTLDDVVALSGFVDPAPSSAGLAAPLDQPLDFSMILNNVPSLGEGQQLADKLAVTLTAFPQAPALAELVPRG